LQHNNNFSKIDNPMTLTTWLLIFGGLTFTAIVMDGLRRMFASHAALKIDIDESLCGLPQEEYPSELPNGGARVVAAASVINTVASSKTEADLEWSVKSAAVELAQEQLAGETEVAEELITEELVVEELGIEDLTVASILVEDLVVEDFLIEDLAVEVSPDRTVKTADSILEIPVVAVQVEDLGNTEVAVLKPDELGLQVSQELDSLDVVSNKETFALDRTPVSLTAEEIVALTTSIDTGDLTVHGAAETSMPALDFDPTRPVHELVETNSMVQSDLFAEQDLSALASVKSHVAHELLETSDDILFSDTGIEELYTDGPSVGDTDDFEQIHQDTSLSKRLAKVTSMTFGKKLLNRKRLAAQEALELAAVEQKTKQVAGVEQVISILVTAKDRQGFYGPQLQQLVEACGLVHGEMNIFHRFEDGLRLGKTQFSMANMMEPGTFDLSTMDHLHTPGVVFFLGLPTAQDSMQAFDYMLETAQCLASNLGGEVLDEQRSVMRPQTIEHCRQQVREFERRNMTRRVQL
jgi:cell division protein ZipA